MNNVDGQLTMQGGGIHEIEVVGKEDARGQVMEHAVSPYCWVSMPKTGQHLPVCKEPLSPCPDSKKLKALKPGETVKVVGMKDRFFQLAGGIGWIASSSEMHLLSKTASLERQQELEAALSLDNKKVEGGTILSAFNDAWTSTPAESTKFLVGMGLFIGGFLTHGVLWLAASGVGLATGSTDLALAITVTERVLSQVSYVVLALEHFEKLLFDGLTDHVRCVVGDGHDQPCDPGFTCVRQGVFSRRTLDARDGFCVRAPLPLVPVGGLCSVDIDCASGICMKTQSSESVEPVALTLEGKCSVR